MNDIFNLRRFGKYFWSEIKCLVSGKGISMLAIGLIPIFIFLISLIFSLLSDGFEYMGLNTRVGISIFTMVIFIIWTPASLFGYVTDRRKGAVYILTPVSSFEKTLSMVINIVITAPVMTGAIYLISDIITTIVSGYGLDQTVAAAFFDGNFIRTFTGSDISGGITNFHVSILTFLLGALIFRKNKIAKTILSLIVLSILIGFLTFAGIRCMLGIDSINFWENISEMSVTMWGYIINAASTIILLTCVYLRVRKIQY